MHQTPKFTASLSLEGRSPETTMALLFAAAQRLQWTIGKVDATGLDAYTKFNNHSWEEEITIHVSVSQIHVQSQNAATNTNEPGNNQSNVEQLFQQYEHVLLHATEEEINSHIEQWQKILFYTDAEANHTHLSPAEDPTVSLFAIFRPVKNYFVTPLIININILIFILMVVSGVHFLNPSNEGLLRWGANYRPITLDGEWWRWITSCFEHIGIIHLLFNMYALFYIGLLLEPYLGKIKFLLLYLATGIIASITSTAWHDMSVAAGASGAIFGMYGVFLALFTTDLIEKKTRKVLLTSILVFVGFNLLNGFKPEIDNAAHLGGLISGGIFGMIMIPALKKQSNLLSIALTTTIVVIVFTAGMIAYQKLPNNIKTYEDSMKTFDLLQDKALEYYRLPDSANATTQLHALNENGIRYWKENITLLENLAPLDLPEEIKKRNDALKKYCEFRVKSYQFKYQTLLEQQDKYLDSIRYYDAAIDTLLLDLNKGRNN